MTIGIYPTPVQRLDALSTARTVLWVKRDDLTHPIYGGNKVRKLEHILDDARRRGKKRIVTIGAAGSHHVLATAVHAKAAGLGVDAVMVAQPRSAHVVENLRADVALGVRIHRAAAWALVPLVMLWRLVVTAGAYFLTAGGSSVLGAMGYVDGARELVRQVRAGELPEPDVVIVTCGSGGTAAGLAAGFALEGFRTRVVAVLVAEPEWFVRWTTRRLARACVRRAATAAAGEASARERTHGALAALDSLLVVDGRYLGGGYGHPTAKGESAMVRASTLGLALDATYTAKTFAATLDLVDQGAYANVLYWHTLSSAPMAPLLERAPSEDALPPPLKHLLR